MITLTTAAATSSSLAWTVGAGVAAAQGTFGSGTFTVEASFDAGANWITLTDDAGDDLALTDEGMFSFALPACIVRGVLTGSTGATIGFTILPAA
jgi:hypothetical protein